MQRIGRYEVTDRLGAGSFATVHRAHDLRLDDEVAVKAQISRGRAKLEKILGAID